MANPERVEVLVIGSGEAGKWVAWDLAAAGHRTAVIERRWIGGSCPNINCLPSKNEIVSAKVADVVRHAAAFGTDVAEVRTNMPKVLARKRKMVEAEVAFHRQRYRETGGELILGEARFVAPKTVEVRLNDGGTRLLSGDRVFLNIRRCATPSSRIRRWPKVSTRSFLESVVDEGRNNLPGFSDNQRFRWQSASKSSGSLRRGDRRRPRSST